MNINEIITAYLEAKETENAAKKRAEAMKALILAHAGTESSFTTEEYNVIIRNQSSARLDTAALYKDFPDIKETYGYTTVSKIINAARLAGSAQKSA